MELLSQKKKLICLRNTKEMSNFLVIRKMQSGTILRLHLTLVSVAKINKTSDSSPQQACEGIETFIYCCRNSNLQSHCGNQCGCFSGRCESIYPKIQLSHTYVIYQSVASSYCRDIFSIMFIVDVFGITLLFTVISDPK